jgi:hypothetical protein
MHPAYLQDGLELENPKAEMFNSKASNPKNMD